MDFAAWCVRNADGGECLPDTGIHQASDHDLRTRGCHEVMYRYNEK